MVYCFDNAVLAFVGSVESLLQETYAVTLGNREVTRSKYALDELLRDDFRVSGESEVVSSASLKHLDGGEFYDEVRT